MLNYLKKSDRLLNSASNFKLKTASLNVGAKEVS